ncbi:aminotransferase class V-fold PLP-dependent enzyme [Aliikangiella coralliicola]|uniref:Aminotransferase class V-fold PLP-dependent enzyme n=1 Tax=Aliikangiella coralliicola TaxID=2592383 RepID=A0A545UE96_9GAMM|nr:aminotransferase class V-fold PLP-dependent enzyme [Aliikangiella coralliicola]TQV87800.1 aminotransferase class V-fold PLP-dependent enzyme [Aliikangiella coralliicola]
MERRNFLTHLGGSLATTALMIANNATANPALNQSNDQNLASGPNSIRKAFSRLEKDIYLNAAGMMPLSTFSEKGLQQYLNFQRLGYNDGDGEYVSAMQNEIRELFASLIKAKVDEIGLVHCTKAGEQIVLDAIDSIKSKGSIVTNDLHFSGSLHNLIGLKKSGRDVRIVKAEDWRINLEKMKSAIDERTALVNVSLVSNINGHIEAIGELAQVAHQHGAIVYADIIQAAGIVPIDVHKMGIDVAACSCYKWLYGVHGTGFLFVSEKLQGSKLQDRLFPGSIRHNYAPWVETPELTKEDFIYQAKTDATRYQPGHISYLGYCAAYEGLKFIKHMGVETLLRHSVKLNRQLKSMLNKDRFECISPNIDASPIITFRTHENDNIKAKLKKAGIVVSYGKNRLRVSPAIYNNSEDIEKLALVLNEGAIK